MTNLRSRSFAFLFLGMICGGLTTQAADVIVLTYADKACTFSLVSSSFPETQDCDNWDDSDIGKWYGEGFFSLFSYESLKAEKTGYTATWYTYPSSRKSAFEEGASQATKQIGTGDTMSASTLAGSAASCYASQNRKVVYVRWTPVTYTISFDAGGATGGDTEPVTCTYDDDKILPQCGFTKSGYQFAGWATKPGGPVIYKDREKVKNLTYIADGEVVLYASWKVPGYTVTLDDTGGSGGSGSVSVQYGQNMPTARKPSRLGYTFLGYWDHNGRTNEWVQYYNAEMSSQHTWEMERGSTLYAHWKPITYTVTLDGNGATSTTGQTQFDCTYDIDPQITNPFTKGGVEFKGWGLSKLTVKYKPEEKLINLTTVDKSKITLYAIWSTSVKPEVVTSALAEALGCKDLAVTNIDENWKWVVDKNEYAPNSSDKSSVRYQVEKPNRSNGLKIHITRQGVVNFKYKGNVPYEGYDEEALKLKVTLPGAAETNLICDTVWTNSPCFAVSEGDFIIRAMGLEPGDVAWVDDFVFKQSVCIIEVAAEANGKVSDGTKKDMSLTLTPTVDKDVTLQAIPDPGYEFEKWEGIKAEKSTVTFKAQDNVSIVAYFTPMKPELKLTTGTTRTKLTWEKIAWADQYVLYRSAGTDKPVESFQTFNSLKTEYTDTSATSQSSYSYWLEARSGAQTTCSKRVSIGGRSDAKLKSLSLSPAKTSLKTGEKTSLKTGEKTTCSCNAVYEDKTTRTVSATWSVVSGSEYATVTPDGEVTACNTTKQKQTVKLRAVYEEDGIALDEELVLTVTPTSTRSDDKYEVSVSYDETRGTVSGTGAYAPGKTVTLKATAKTGYVFDGWYDDTDVRLAQSASYRCKVNMADVSLTAKFVSVSELMGDVSVTVGDVVFTTDNTTASTTASAAMAVCWDVVVNSKSEAKLTVSGLPSGLKYKGGQIVGVPTRGGKTSVAKLTLKVGKLSQVFVLNIAVTALPDFVIGTFTGGATGNDAGVASLTVSAAGKVTGKWVSGGKTWKLSATSFSSGDAVAGVYVADLVAKSGKEAQTLSLSIDATGVARTELFETLWSNWKTDPWKSIAKSSVNGVSDTILFSDGSIDVKFSSTGAAKAKGVFDGYTASVSSVLCPINGQEDVFGLFLYFPPKTSKSVDFPGYADWFSYVIRDGRLVRADAE